jgi:nonribosomal peptide synthetase protein BlmVII
VSHRGRQVTYAALDARAERLARALRALGVEPESLVGVCAQPSVGLVAAILGVLKSGGAYVPLSADDPPARLSALVADAAPAVVVGDRGALDRVGRLKGTTVLALDEPSTWPEGVPPAGDVPPDAAAYVIYTSGTTGTPKGVVVAHANVARLFAAARRHLAPAPADVWLLSHSIAFDFSVWELWGALAHGGRLVIADRDVVRSPSALWKLVCAERISVLSQTPSAFAELARHPLDDGAGPLTHVVLGGERCEPPLLRHWAAAHGLQRPAVLNLYGITEATVHATAHRLEPEDLGRRGRSPIGSPLADVDAVVEDQWGLPVLPGGRGELLVGGAGVARGYLGSAAPTAERFVPAAGGARRYRSGDVVRVLPDGTLDYVGRTDDQIDLRGHRIEPAEVEAALSTHPGVAAVAVARRELEAGRPALVAYVAGAPLDAAALRRRATERLPAHMVPMRFVVLDRLPLTRNGKLDRAALPDPLPARNADPPRTPTERTLAGLWCELTGADSVDLGTGLLQLGADSLLLARLHARLPDAFGVQVPLREVFDAAGLSALAETIDAERAELERLLAEVERMSDEEVRRLRR